MTTTRADLLIKLTADQLEELAQTIRVSLDYADRTADTLRAWLRLVEDELERKSGI